MTGYFSNQTVSRFPTATTTTGSPSATTPTGPTTPSIRPHTAAVTHLHPATKRMASSKLFSTSVGADGKPAGVPVHPLHNTWVFWFRQQRAPGNKITNYEEGIKKISSFASVESFWSLWTHLAPPSALLPTTDYLLFHAGVRRPVWEDPLNITGGKWIIRLRKGVADRLWEDLVLAVVGDQFDGCSPSPAAMVGERVPEDTPVGEWPEICGCTISVRQSEDIVSLWNRHEVDPKNRDKIKETVKKLLNLPASTVMEYKTNNDSMQDKSSFRMTPVDRTPLA